MTQLTAGPDSSLLLFYCNMWLGKDAHNLTEKGRYIFVLYFVPFEHWSFPLTSRNMSWNSLPVEIQTHILESLVLQGNSARYASTSRVWQTIIEPRIFARLKVTRSRLISFNDIGYRHRHLIKCIWFSITPSECHCPQCGDIAFYYSYHLSSKVIRKAIQDLIICLSTWEPNDGLLLDISVKAPSALMNPSGIIQDGPSIILEPKMERIIQCSHRLHDTSLRGSYLINKTFNINELEPQLRQQMPKARVVTSLLLRRQTRHLWKSDVFRELLDLLPEVHDIHYEPWRDWRRMEERSIDTSKTDQYGYRILLTLYSYNTAM